MKKSDFKNLIDQLETLAKTNEQEHAELAAKVLQFSIFTDSRNRKVNFSTPRARLRQLNMRNCDLKDLSCVNLACFPRLENFILENNPIKKLPQELFIGVSKLYYLDLSDVPLLELSSRTFYGLTQLEHLLLNNTKLNNISKDVFKPLKNLKRLAITSTPSLYFKKYMFSELKTLKFLSLAKNRIRKIQEELFSGLDNLGELILSNNLLTELPLKMFENLPSLSKLWLDENSFPPFFIYRRWYENRRQITKLMKDLSKYEQMEKYGVINDYIDSFIRLLDLDEVKKEGKAGEVQRAILIKPLGGLEEGEMIAVKIYKPEIFEKSPNQDKRILKELSAGRILDHPFLVKSYYSAFLKYKNRKRPCLLMEFVEGKTLEDWIPENFPLSFQEVKRLCIQLFQVVDYIHQPNKHQGFIHRDIKPANIIITPTGDLKLLDFGVIKDLKIDLESSLTSSQRISGSDQFVGTIRYSAPEFLLKKYNFGKFRGPEIDYYSVGAVLYFIMKNKHIYNSEYWIDWIIEKHSGNLDFIDLDQESNEERSSFLLLVKKLLAVDYSVRPSPKEILQMFNK